MKTNHGKNKDCTGLVSALYSMRKYVYMSTRTKCIKVCPSEGRRRLGVCVGVCFSGDGGKLFEQDVLTQRVQRDILPHI